MVGGAWGNFGVGFVGRPLHPCGRGCCASRADSVDKGMKLIERVVLKRIPQPAQNKWTKMDPAFCQATLVACFFGLVKSVLEVIVSVTYEALTAMTPAAFGQFVEEDVVEEILMTLRAARGGMDGGVWRSLVILTQGGFYSHGPPLVRSS